jgi:hypothetical protein
LRDAFDHVHQHYVRQFLIGNAEGAIGAYVAGAYNGNFLSQWKLLLCETGLYRLLRRPYNGVVTTPLPIPLPGAAADLSGLYDEDFFEWTGRNAQLLREGKVRESDIAHIAAEIENLGKQDLKELRRRVRALLAHLLVGRLQPAKHAHFRLSPVTVERIWLDGLLEQSPSLRIKLANEMPVYYEEAVRLAMAMSRAECARGRFPAECPFTVEQILDG